MDFTYTYPVSFLSKCHRKEVLAVRISYRKEVLALLSCNRKEVLAVSRTQAQVTRNQPQEELLLADAKRSSCACIIFGLYCSLLASVCSLCIKQSVGEGKRAKSSHAKIEAKAKNRWCQGWGKHGKAYRTSPHFVDIFLFSPQFLGNENVEEPFRSYADAIQFNSSLI